ncbi:MULTISPECIES: hypothetical protein [unclassified Rothia (in: high G+C Gram-positive bacteria)]|uniref:hypothetical protein n=1 Tax=unclassified Rothia (in: high G+C Gram-positive bacteria) TaxID=2689056 RepID=UPI0019589A63|nr:MULTISPECIES: hypothetical protein [unclassified Rothia (in: high G+C Gram-positive bacteria)]MBM7051126.1 hypothetical protein [Rothia sp. ZJ1223]QRZ62175.1 hypothetical protein JR346_03405 [Rothia sp. ZJ932]
MRNPEHRFLMRMGGINELFRQILGVDVDVVVPEILCEKVSQTEAYSKVRNHPAPTN